MNLEQAIESEVSQTEENKFHILTREIYMESRKMVLRNLFAGKRVLHHPCEDFVYFNSRGDLSSLMPDSYQNTEIT